MPIPCKTCSNGDLEHRRVYRMSGVVVAIGYIMLVPSILGILFSALYLFLVVNAAPTNGGHGATMFVVGGFGVFIGLLSLVSGLLGWLLIMKKAILQCTNCRATVAAS